MSKKRLSSRKITKPERHVEDGVRRWTRRGVARAVIENNGNESYFETHPIADDLRRSKSTAKIERLANERNPQGATHMAMFSIGCLACEGYGYDHVWPCEVAVKESNG